MVLAYIATLSKHGPGLPKGSNFFYGELLAT
jgi:hypothetical protein